MNTHADKTQSNKSRAVANSPAQLQSNGEPAFQMEDNRPEAIAQREVQLMANNSAQVRQLAAYQEMANSAQKENRTGLPNNLKSGIENLSGVDISDVKVHYNSSQPAQLNAFAYAQGTDIHVAPGQEQHLPHEAWHVVQQKQGRVQATTQLKSNVAINDDPGLEQEADVMGAKAFNHTGSTNMPLQQKPATGPVVQRVNAEEVTTFFRNMKAARPGTLDLYTHVMADGIGDASLIGHLHEKITSEMAAYGIGNVNTYLAVEKLITMDEMDDYEENHEDDNIVAFNLHNPFIDQANNAGYKNLVTGMSKAIPGNIVWSTTLNANAPNKAGGRTASNISGNNWEIQYPVPASDAVEGHKLKIKEMGVNAIAAFAKTGEINDGIGYGIPELNPDINDDEQAVVDQAALHCNPNHAWLASIKGVGGVDPLPRVILAARRDGGNNTLIYLPGGIGAALATTPHYTVNGSMINQGGLNLRKIDITTGGAVYAITGVFRNEFIHDRMMSITNGVILSGGEGLFTESLATTEAGAAPVMVPRYNYQREEVVRGIATNQGNLATAQVVKYADGSLATSALFADYGVVRIDGVAFSYHQANQELKSIYGPNRKEVHAIAPADQAPDGHAEIGYSQQLSSLYFPMSLNTNEFSHVPAQYDFQVAKATFAAERTRLKADRNWFDIVSRVSQEQASSCPCYITTACTLIRGLPDDCEELTVLRQLRDEYILKRPEGKDLVQLYYDFAPSIVRAINRREDYYTFYKRLYIIIRKCVDLALQKEFEAAYTIYCYMVHRLKEELLPDLDIDIPAR